jgi:hypothetical protein
MNSETNAVPNGPQDFTQCPDWGKGGSYVYDPVTQTRTRVPDEDNAQSEAIPEAAPAPAEDVAAESTPVKKEKARA